MADLLKYLIVDDEEIDRLDPRVSCPDFHSSKE
jgi:hypothetical protein